MKTVHGHIPRKRFGQNFLHDPGIVARILAAVDARPGQRLVEIGPGLGAITLPLLRACGRLEAVELDRDLIPRLVEQARGVGELVIHHGDVLDFDFAALAGSGEKLRLVGNLPYNISTPLLFHLLAQAHAIADMHFMLQKEVVERMAAGPGEEAYSRLSVMVQYRCRVQPLFLIRPGAFNPPPKVDSAFVRLLPHPRPPVAVADETRFAQVVQLAFGQRRKTLRNSLKGLLESSAIAACGIDPGARPQTLSLPQFAALANAIG
ncbi:MAG TPA: 16S rRNA (adenine(1518)-N(6)/adenine(1519)-N(6))-dimethyltransferase RsmA [Candidatus Competibacteraceae bacterium]|nr:16S rRNA (adenine(1518)-N(6)/adenine(1519)-N(6))-dimethyltransferase RsmA [Candidatus Competibacteraceae bacterium]